jgi:hypothetical protein
MAQNHYVTKTKRRNKSGNHGEIAPARRRREKIELECGAVRANSSDTMNSSERSSTE